jgi:hypothetical protein
VIIGNSSGNPINDGFLVIARDITSNPAPGEIITVNFSGSGVRPHDVQLDGASSDCNTLTISKVTDVTGSAVFYPRIGGYENLEIIEVRSDGILLARVVARSTDIDGNGATGLGDLDLFRVNFFGNPGAQETDYDLSGSTDLGDLNIFREEFFSGVNGTLCN